MAGAGHDWLSCTQQLNILESCVHHCPRCFANALPLRPQVERSSSQTLSAAFAPFRTCRFNQWSHRFRPSLFLHALSSPLSHAAAACSDRQHQATCRRRRRWPGLQQNARRIVRRRNNSSSRPPAPSIARGCAAAPTPAAALHAS